MRASERAHTRCVFAEALVCDEGGGSGGAEVHRCVGCDFGLSGI